MQSIYIKHYSSPAGELILGSFNDKLCLCDWTKENRRDAIDKKIQNVLHAEYVAGTSEVIEAAVSQLNEYFSLNRTTFDIPLIFTGTDFQESVWNELLKIPYGTTVSYGELSKRLCNPKAVRAVAAANGANPISIFVPCHRVIGSNNKLVGYGGGLEAKRVLLNLEAKTQVLF